MEFKGYIAILKQRWLWAVTGFLLVMTAYFGVLQTRGVEYKSDATLLIQAVPNFRYEILEIKPVRLTEKTVYDYLDEDEWWQAAAMVKQAAVLTNVSPRKFVDENYSIKQIKTVLEEQGKPLHRNPDELQSRAGSLRSVIQGAQSSKMSQLYRVKGRGSSREEAKLNVNAYLAAAVIKGDEVAQQSFRRIRKLLKQDRGELKERIGDRSAANYDRSDSEDGGESLMERYYRIIKETDSSANRLEDLRARMTGYRNELNDIRSRLTEINVTWEQNKQLQNMVMTAISEKRVIGDVPVPQSVKTSEITDRVKNEIQELKMDLAEDRQSRTENHPKVREKQARLNFLQEQLPALEGQDLRKALSRFRAKQRELQVKKEGFNEREQELVDKINSLSQPIAKLENIRKQVEEAEKQISVINQDLQKLKKVETAQRLVATNNWATSTSAITEQAAISIWAAIALGLLAGVVLAYLRDYFDATIRNDYDIRRYLNLPIFALVREEEDKDMVLIKDHPVKAPVSEIFNTGATLLHSTMKEGGFETISFTSSVSKEGKTTMTINFGTAFARKGLRTAIVDMDLRGPRLHKRLDLQNGNGVATFLKKQVNTQPTQEEYQDILNKEVFSICRQTDVENLTVIPGGPGADKPVRLLESPYLPGFIDFLSDEFDVVLVDTPPVKSVGDSLTIARHVDGTLMVVGSGMVSKQDANWAKHLLTNVQAHLLGVVMNRYKRDQGVEYYYYNSYYEKDYRYGM